MLIADADELFQGIEGLAGGRAGIADSIDGMSESWLLNGIEIGRASCAIHELRTTWMARQGGGAVPLILIADDPESCEHVLVLGPEPETLRRIPVSTLYGVLQEVAGLRRVEGIRLLTEQLATKSWPA